MYKRQRGSKAKAKSGGASYGKSRKIVSKRAGKAAKNVKAKIKKAPPKKKGKGPR